MALVRQLSAGQVAAATPPSSPKAKAEPSEPEELDERLAAATGKALTKQARSFLGRLHEIYLRSRQTHQLNYWDLHQLGFALATCSWEPIKLWPTFPANEYEFWLYLAHFLNQQGFEILEDAKNFTVILPLIWNNVSDEQFAFIQKGTIKLQELYVYTHILLLLDVNIFTSHFKIQ